jgi:NAD(P) transhydrogenase subunit beta
MGLAEMPTLVEGIPGGTGGGTFATAIGLSILIGGVTLSGSLIAYAKLAGKIWKNRFGPIGTQGLNIVLALGAVGLMVWGCYLGTGSAIVAGALGLTAIALVLGVGLVVPIGGADMPVVISLLNSYSGMAASATGFVLHNNLLIIAGSLVGASGLILTKIMCKAMNRSLTNVLFATFGEQEGVAKKDEGYANVKSASPEECALILDSARKVIIAPGYGLAVAQAQHKVRELASLLEKKGCEVAYAIHPVAGRMPGHMNVLLAEADVPYEQLFDLDQINGEFKNADVAIVLGANDVANPVANTDPKSPIAGMPVLHVWEAQTVMVVKRSLSAGYAGIKNPLFEGDNTLMVFGDAKKVVEEMVTELKGL